MQSKQKIVTYFPQHDIIFCRYCKECPPFNYTEYLISQDVGLRLLKCTVDYTQYEIIDERKYLLALVSGKVGRL